MNNTFEQFLQAYASASPALRELIDSEKIGLLCESVLQGTSNQNPGLKQKLIVQTSNYILSVTPEADFQKNLASVGLDGATSAVLLMGAKKLSVGTVNLTNSVPPTTTQSVSTEIAEAEAMLNALPPIPAVRPSSNPVPPTPADAVYTSTQAAILEEGRMRSIVATPQAAPVSRPAVAQPQWDSEA